MPIDIFDRARDAKDKARQTGRNVREAADQAFDAGRRTADKAAEVTAPVLDEAERMAGEADRFMEHEPEQDDPAAPAFGDEPEFADDDEDAALLPAVDEPVAESGRREDEEEEDGVWGPVFSDPEDDVFY